ncbi:MAG TPA: FAD:protein FMN transferase [Actinospica sp.]|jgi:thiamine biosynthesis lipoprotein|nr:FAD:protein FMN transferase [Actinospica sp.]
MTITTPHPIPGSTSAADPARSAHATDAAIPAPAAAEWRALGCTVRLVVADPGKLAGCRVRLAAWLSAVDDACSRFRPDSEISVACRAAGPVQISPLLSDAIEAALRAARLTDGLVDPTVGAAMAAVGYDRDFSLVEPDGTAIRLTTRPVPGWRMIELERPEPGDPGPSVLRLREGVTVDLGATAKAWAADRAAEQLAEIAGCGVLVSLGGDIAVAGEPPLRENGDHCWRITVRDRTDAPTGDDAGSVPDSPAELGPQAEISITDGGVATSGTASRRWLRGGDLLHHILDPRTGLPAAGPWRTVSVAAGSCLDANIAATAAFLLGAEAPAWIGGHNLPARLVSERGRIAYTAGWPREAELNAVPAAQGPEGDEELEDAAAEPGDAPGGARPEAREAGRGA